MPFGGGIPAVADMNGDGIDDLVGMFYTVFGVTSGNTGEPLFPPAFLWSPNYFGALAGSGGTELLVTPAQHRAANLTDGTSTQRKFTGFGLRLYYSGNLSQAALSEAPSIVGVDAQPAEGGLWQITEAELARVIFAAFVMPTHWADLTGHAYRVSGVQRVRDLRLCACHRRMRGHVRAFGRHVHRRQRVHDR